MDRERLEENVTRELEALRLRLPLLSDTQLSGLLTFLRSVVPECTNPSKDSRNPVLATSFLMG